MLRKVRFCPFSLSGLLNAENRTSVKEDDEAEKE
jgi:hypothetical protein